MITLFSRARRWWASPLTVLGLVYLLAAPIGAALAQTTNFSYTGGDQSYPVPAGVTQIQVVAKGAGGGCAYNRGTNSFGAMVQATITVIPGEVLTVRVGGVGAGYRSPIPAVFPGGFNGGGNGTSDSRGDGGGGGGGATDLRRTSATSTGDYLSSRNALLVAGGGGGSGLSDGGNGGNPNGGRGGVAYGGGSPGQGATQTGPGIGAGGGGSGSNNTGGSGGGPLGGGGGGGGYYGAAGGSAPNSNDYVGGGGGSSWVTPTGSSNSSYSLPPAGGSGSLSITILNTAPSALMLTNNSVVENAGPNATVGTFSTSDMNPGDTFTYTLVTGTGSTDNASFNLSGSTLRLTASADYETKSSYSIRVRTTDQGGLFFEQTFIITIGNVLEFTGTQTNLLCNGINDGTASVTGLTEGTAPYTYSWTTTPAQTTATATGLAAGLYTVTATDAAGVTGTRTYTITQPAALTTFVSLTSPTCGLANGMATVGASGGTGGYTYAWRNQTTNTALPQTTSSVSGLAAGTYQVTVTDANACTITRSFTLTSVADATAPVAAARNITVTIDATGTATVAPADVDNGSTDNCGIASRSLSRTSFTCADVSSGSAPVSAGNALKFDGTDDYVSLPSGAVNPATASGSGFTFEAWVNFAATPATWARIFDFGTGSTTYLFLSPNNGVNGKLRFAILKNSGGEQVIDATSAATLTGWHHYAVTLSKSGTTVTGLLYLDGVQVGSNPAMTLLPGDLGTLTQTWLGRSQFADPYPNATFEEVRLWDVARAASDIAANRSQPLTGTETGLRAYYNFDQTTGTTLPDVTGHGYAGTLQNFAGSGTTSNWVTSTAPVGSGAAVSFGNALAFDGSNDYVALTGAVLPTNAAYTVEAWVYATAGTNRNILSSGTAPVHTFWLDGTNTLAGGHGTSYSAVAAPSTFAFNTWTHVALTYNPTGGVMKLYQNGALLQTASGVSALTAATTANQLGAYAGGSTWSGQLDELRVWDTERTLAQIQATKDAPLTGTETGLRAYYNFDQTTGTSLPDVSGHGYAGTLQNFALSGTTSNWVTSTVPVAASAPSGVLVTLTVTDGAGNQATATARVTVQQPSVASTPTLTWTGAASTTWSDCGNWSYGLVPVASQGVSIPAGLSRYPVLPSGTTSLTSLAIASGASLSLGTGATLQATGNVDNQGPALAGSVSLTGTTAQTLAGSFGTLVVNKASGTTTLSGNASVATALTLTSGTLTTTVNYKVALGTAASLSESDASYVTGAVEITRALSTAGSGDSFGGVGLTLTPATGSPALPGSTLVRRVTGSPATGVNSSTGIGRYFTITPTVDANLNVTLALSYLPHELNGIAQSKLRLFKSENGATGPWARVDGASYNAGTNTVTKPAIASLSTWTLGNADAPLPVELLDFTAKQQGSAVALAWRTASEKNSAAFEVERSRDGKAFERLGAVAAQGSKVGPTPYVFLDSEYPGETTPLYYRLRQVDLDGTASYSPVRAIALHGAGGLSLYPNPARSAVAVRSLAAGAAVQVLDALGRVVAIATADTAGMAQLALPTGLAAGVYVVRSGAQTQRLAVE